MKFEKIIAEISRDVEATRQMSSSALFLQSSPARSAIDMALDKNAGALPEAEKERLRMEFSDTGPLQNLLADENITEIMICSKNEIWYEKKGEILPSSDLFLSELTYNNFIHNLSDEAKVQTNLHFPFANGFWKSFRIHISAPPVTSSPVITMRRLKVSPIRLNDLHQAQWCTELEQNVLLTAVAQKKNIIVVGSTGSGKTTLINSLLAETTGDRAVIIEDTPELLAPNSVSVKMLTRFDAQGTLPEITQTDLVKQSLRMRPDRLVIGEIRGGEAKDLLMALSTGHRGSFSSIHAHSANEALLRLEMLVQMGAPQWQLEAIRRLIQLCVDYLVVTRKEKDRWYLEGIYQIASQEKFGFIVQKI